MEFDEIVVKESPGLCRCCLSEGCYKDMGTEYTWMNENEVYADMLLECFDIGISQHNDGPNGPNRLICEVCITRLRDACNFKKQVLDSEKKFVDMVGRGEFRPKVLIYQSQMKSEANEETAGEDAEVEYLEEIDFGDDDEPLKNEPSASEIAVEPLPVSKRGRPRKTLKAEKKKPKVDERPKTSKALVKGDNGQISATGRANLHILLDNTTVIPFRWKHCFMCFYCGKHMNEPSEIRLHTEKHGNCGLLKTTQTISKLRASEKCVKLDISNLTCKICQVNFIYLDDIIDHLIEEHAVKYVKGAFMYMRQYNLSKSKCPACLESFVYSSFLIKHVDETHELLYYPCDLCPEEFSSEEYLEEHKNSVHWDKDNNNAKMKYITTIVNMSNVTPFKGCRGNRVFDCYSCTTSFVDFVKLRNHHASQHKDFIVVPSSKPVVIKLDTADLACRECSESLNDIEALIDHLRTKHGVEIPNDVLRCIQQIEIDRTYLCRICNVSFKKYLHLSRHISEKHTSPDILCQQCGLGFTSMALYNKHTSCYEANEDDATNQGLETVNSQDHYEKWLEKKGFDVAAKKKKLEIPQETPEPAEEIDTDVVKKKQGNKRGRNRSAHKH